MSYRLINANNITFNSDGFITAENIEKMPCIYVDLPNGMDGEHKRLIDADELLKRIAEKCKIPSLSKDTVNGLCGATAIIYDMLNESEEKE